MYSTCCASGSPPIEATYRRCSGSFRYARLVSSSWRYVQPSSPGRDRQLRDAGCHVLREKREGVAEDRLGDADLAADVRERGHELDVALLVVERDLDLVVGGRDPVERIDEVHVPGAPPELAVGDPPQADLLLHADGVRDGTVLDRAQLLAGDPAGGRVLPRPEQLWRAEQAADMVGAERGLGASCHGHSPRSRGLRRNPNVGFAYSPLRLPQATRRSGVPVTKAAFHRRPEGRRRW
jgi:hypothetical protein